MSSVAQLTRLELKYCEGCGALCLRPSGSSVAYCDPCRKKLPRTAEQLAPLARAEGSVV